MFESVLVQNNETYYYNFTDEIQIRLKTKDYKNIVDLYYLSNENIDLIFEYFQIDQWCF